MAYMRNAKEIQINGTVHKKKLRFMGYFHGYKGYRYCNSVTRPFSYTKFEQVQAVYDFDMSIKSALYPRIMFLETVIKNYALEVILEEIGSEKFVDVYAKAMNAYKGHPIGSQSYEKEIKRSMAVRNKIYENIARDYNRDNIISHYYKQDKPVPIWAIFETLSLGEFGQFLGCLNKNIRRKISRLVGIHNGIDADGNLIGKIVLSLKDLRNAVAHNNTIFDTRFKKSSIDGRISRYIMSETGMNEVNFKSIVDYVILVAFMMKLLKCGKKDICSFIKEFENNCDVLYNNVPMNIYSRIVYTNTKRKLRVMRNYI